MKGVRIVLLGVAIGTITASPLWADQNKTVGEQMKGAAENAGQGIENGAEATGHAIEKGAEKTGKFLGITSSEAARFAANERAEHRVYGKITHVNHDSGAVAVKTTQAPLELQFPSHTVRRLHKGDRITVQLAYAVIAPANSASNAAEGRAPNAQHTSERAAKSAGPEITRGEHWIKGTVSAVDHQTGIMHLTSKKAGTLKLQFPPADIANLNAGDRIAVEMAFAKGKHVENAPTNG